MAPDSITEELPTVAPEEASERAVKEAPHEAPRREREPEERIVNPFLTCLAVFLAVASAAWMCSGIFRGLFYPKLVGLLGAGIGVGSVALSYRSRRPSVLQYLALPSAVVVGAILVWPDATGGSANLPGLVAEAIRAGGVAQPPIPFDPGWRFILLVLMTVLGAAGASLATGMSRPKIGTLTPVPLIFAAAMVQPTEGVGLTTAVALALLVGALAVGYGVELAKEGATSGQFEVRRLGRGSAIVAVLLLVLYALSQLGFLFPEADQEQVIPPKRPEVQPPQQDRVLFTVSADRPGPWRLGVLDVYDGLGWLLPPYDTKRFVDVPDTGRIPQSYVEGVEDAPDLAALAGEKREEAFTATFEVFDVEGHVLPTTASPRQATRAGEGFSLWFDPRTQMLRLPDRRARQGMKYTVSAPPPPNAAMLAEAPAPPEVMEEYLEAPQAPLEMSALLAEAPELDEDPFARLQFVRNAFYEKVVAAGSGEPVDVPPVRVVEMLEGAEATPFEITAAEALLARWAGIPSRIGYGFYAGEKDDPSSPVFEVRPRHGATWLEAYFHGAGWVPIIGTPPRAKASLSDEEQNPDPEIRPTEELALVVYIPVRLQSIQLLFVVIRYWVAVILPFLFLTLLAWGFYPGLIKATRRLRRRRWAIEHGPRERIAVAYGEFRDIASDLNIGDTTVTPLEFLEYIEPDGEHSELAWLVTRSLWGDLQRGLRVEDAEAAEDMARSVTKRLRREQPATARVLALGTRASLRDPFTDEVPNLWPQWAREPLAVRRALQRVVSKGNPWRLLRRRPALGGAPR